MTHQLPLFPPHQTFLWFEKIAPKRDETDVAWLRYGLGPIVDLPREMRWTLAHMSRWRGDT